MVWTPDPLPWPPVRPRVFSYIDTRPEVCYTLGMEPMTDRIATTEGLLRAREEELDRRLLESPEVLAQRVEVEMIKNLRWSAPWLIPLIINK